MPLSVNLHHLEAHGLHLQGELDLEELDIDPHDEVIRLSRPLQYDLEAEKLEKSLLIQGRLHLDLDCQCVRCLKPFHYRLDLSHWTCHLPLEGEEHAAVVNDCVDLTPYVREDILLEFPRHPVCGPECRGLPKPSSAGKAKAASSAGKPELPVWAELNKLKF
jgi:uncharacterized metal-binding protein YceD (DUF177 family)